MPRVRLPKDSDSLNIVTDADFQRQKRRQWWNILLAFIFSPLIVIVWALFASRVGDSFLHQTEQLILFVSIVGGLVFLGKSPLDGWKLALAVLLFVPLMGFLLGYVFLFVVAPMHGGYL